jgi:hypothetical protein
MINNMKMILIMKRKRKTIMKMERKKMMKIKLCLIISYQIKILLKTISIFRKQNSIKRIRSII